jgi:hypothetical protein
MTSINNAASNWEEEIDYKSTQGEDSIIDNQRAVKEEDTTAPPKPDPPTNQPLV